MLDAMLLRIAPRLAAQRAESRLRASRAETAATMLRQAYDAAAAGGRHSGWVRPATSANAENQPALRMVRASARELVRNNPYASRGVRVLASHIVGRGIRPRPEVGEDEAELGDAAKDQWRRFVENCDPEGMQDWHGQQRLFVRTMVESGEALRLWIPVADRGRLFWRCRVLEGDQLDHMRNEALPGGGRIVQGVEFDALGRRVAYWLHRGHPGDRFSIATTLTSERVPAEYVDHGFEVLRPGQARGVSWFAPVALGLRDTADVEEAAVVKRKVEACLAAVVVNPEGSAATTGVAALDPATDGANGTGAALTDAGGDPIERLRPAMIAQATAGWDVKFLQPTSSADLVEHMKHQLGAVAAGLGVTYAQLTGDLSGANYSSMREGRIEFERLVDGWQDDLMHQTCRPAWRRVMSAAEMNGELNGARAPRARWIRPGRPWVDPAKDMNAMLDGARAGVVSPFDIAERQGEDPAEVIAEARRWQAETDGLRLSIDYSEEAENAGEHEP